MNTFITLDPLIIRMDTQEELEGSEIIDNPLHCLQSAIYITRQEVLEAGKLNSLRKNPTG